MTHSLVGQRIRPPVSPDAVLVIPGIMGSTLESASGVIWGIHSLGWYRKAWERQSSALDELILTADEQEGHYGRIRATGLLHKPAWAPFLQSIDPYEALLKGIREVVVHSDAVYPFPYDWRLSVAYNAKLLETRARWHLKTWQNHQEYLMFRKELPDARPAQLVLVAHSMGGLLARALPADMDIRATVTLGTPFDGSAKAAMILNTGRGAPIPLPRTRLQKAARSMPGLHDLLPMYRCLDDVDHDSDPVRLTPIQVKEFGGDENLAAESFAAHERVAGRQLPDHHVLAGIKQSTFTSLTLKAGVLEGQPYTFEPTPTGIARDRHGILVRQLRHGDGTVPYDSALPDGVQAVYLAQQHGPIAGSKESVDLVCAVICERNAMAPRLGGDGDLSLDLPDLVEAGEEFTVEVGGVDGPTDATVIVHGEDDVPFDYPRIYFADGGYQTRLGPFGPGIYRIEVSGGDTSSVSQRVMVTET